MAAKLKRIMYIEDKSSELAGAARIGVVVYSKTRQSLTYKGREFHRTTNGFSHNYYEVETGAPFWISGPKKRGGDRLFGTGVVEIDDEARVQYWTKIRELPANSDLTSYRG